MCARDLLADVLSIHRAREGHRCHLDIPVEHFGVVHKTSRVVAAKTRSTVDHLLRIGWEIYIATYGSGEFSEEVRRKRKRKRKRLFRNLKHVGSESRG